MTKEGLLIRLRELLTASKYYEANKLVRTELDKLRMGRN